MANCRFCEAPLNEVFVDLGVSPLSNSYLNAGELNRMEPFYPLRVFLCDKCFLAQLEGYEEPEHIFNKEYAYFSSFSDTWVKHASDYVEMIAKRMGLHSESHVVEIASNDGYLLQFFVQKNIPALGIEPAANCAAEAKKKGVKSQVKFFGVNTAQELKAEGAMADLLLGNNVLAHVPDINDFVAGMKIVLKPEGVITMEFPHLMRLIEQNQYDTIYHEHFSYLSLIVVEKIFAVHGLTIFDVDQISTHGGSLRIYARHAEHSALQLTEAVEKLKKQEVNFGIENVEIYRSFAKRVIENKRDALEFLIRAKKEGKTIVGYGAPAKGNTFLNFCGVRSDMIDFTVDRSPHKQGMYLPGSRIPVMAPEVIEKEKPDYLIILPWNIKDEIIGQMSHIREWGGKFVTFIPKLSVFS